MSRNRNYPRYVERHVYHHNYAQEQADALRAERDFWQDQAATAAAIVSQLQQPAPPPPRAGNVPPRVLLIGALSLVAGVIVIWGRGYVQDAPADDAATRCLNIINGDYSEEAKGAARCALAAQSWTAQAPAVQAAIPAPDIPSPTVEAPPEELSKAEAIARVQLEVDQWHSDMERRKERQR